jgi:hypothetical protein
LPNRGVLASDRIDGGLLAGSVDDLGVTVLVSSGCDVEDHRNPCGNVDSGYVRADARQRERGRASDYGCRSGDDCDL